MSIFKKMGSHKITHIDGNCKRFLEILSVEDNNISLDFAIRQQIGKSESCQKQIQTVEDKPQILHK